MCWENMGVLNVLESRGEVVSVWGISKGKKMVDDVKK